MYIVVEGMDGVGKTTMANNLVLKLQQEGYDAERWVEPTNPEIIELIEKAKQLKVPDSIKEYGARFKDDLFTCLFTADRYLKVPELLEKLDSGKIIISDRSYVSTLAYQYRCGLDLLTAATLFVVEPDLMIYLDADPRTAYNRIVARDKGTNDPFEKIQNLELVGDKYYEAMDYLPCETYIIDTEDATVQEVFEDCLKVVKELLEE